MYDYSTELGILAKQRKIRENKTGIVSNNNWRKESYGSCAVGDSTLSAIYNSIKFTLGFEDAENFLKNF